MSYYHYTKGCHLPSIVKDGIIETSKVLLDKHEKPAVWLTKSPEWEVACNIGKILNADEFVSGKEYPIDAINSVTVKNVENPVKVSTSFRSKLSMIRKSNCTERCR
jgi:hypothetical protein